jgi:hypothetical protein
MSPLHGAQLSTSRFSLRQKEQSMGNALTEEKVQDIHARLEISLHKLLKCLAQESGVLLRFVSFC